MDVLLVEMDPLLRDLVKVGLQQFPGVQVTVGSGLSGVSLAQGKRFGCVFVGVDPRDQSSVQLLQHLRSFEDGADLFVLTESRNVKDMAGDKARYRVHSFVPTPVVVKDFFGMFSRYLERRSEGRAPRKQARVAATPASR